MQSFGPHPRLPDKEGVVPSNDAMRLVLVQSFILSCLFRTRHKLITQVKVNNRCVRMQDRKMTDDISKLMELLYLIRVYMAHVSWIASCDMVSKVDVVRDAIDTR